MAAQKQQDSIMATTKNVLQFIGSANDPVVTSTELAEEFNVSQQWAYEKLSKLHKSGEIEKKKVGARGAVWFIKKDYSVASDSMT